MDALVEELKRQIVTQLCLEDVTPDEIEDDAPLFEEGLGLDSIDALELVVMLEREHKVKIENMEEGKKAFASVSAMADYIRRRQP